MSAKHTQGEWDVNEFTDLEGDHHVQIVLKSNGCPIAHLYECGSETRHNALLIAAAPELLAFVQEFLADYQSLEGMASMKYYAGKAHAAIAKATGGEQ